MGLRMRARRASPGPATAKEKRGRTPKARPTLAIGKRQKKSSGDPRLKSSKTFEPRGSSSKPLEGSSSYTPITLDSDEEEEEEEVVDDNSNLDIGDSTLSARSVPGNATRLTTNLDHSRYKPYELPQSASTPSRYSPLSNSHSPAGFVLGREAHSSPVATPSRTKRTKKHGTSAIIPFHVASTKNRRVKFAFEDLEQQPSRYSDMLRTPPRRKRATRDRVFSSPTANKAKVEEELFESGVPTARQTRDKLGYTAESDLANFTNVGMRKKVLSTKLSQTLCYLPRSEVTRNIPSSRSPASDEIMVKIDPSDPRFDWDTASPHPEPTQKRKTQPSKSNSKLDQHCYTNLHESTTRAKRQKKSSQSRSSIGVKRAKETSFNHTHARETSSDREFLVADNDIVYDTGDSFETGDSGEAMVASSSSDVEMGVVEGELDLEIDMEPQFAFNAKLLGRKM